LASAIGGVLAGLLGGDATVDGLSSVQPIFTFMIQYYAVIALALIIMAYFFKSREKS
jgi:hypothetical protein